MGGCIYGETDGWVYIYKYDEMQKETAAKVVRGRKTERGRECDIYTNRRRRKTEDGGAGGSPLGEKEKSMYRKTGEVPRMKE